MVYSPSEPVDGPCFHSPSSLGVSVELRHRISHSGFRISPPQGFPTSCLRDTGTGVMAWYRKILVGSRRERSLGSGPHYLKALRSFSPSGYVRSFFSNSSSKRVRE